MSEVESRMVSVSCSMMTRRQDERKKQSRCFWWVVLFMWWGAAVHAQGPGKIAVFVQGEDSASDRAATWVEGLWIGEWKSRTQDTEGFLGDTATAEADGLKQAVEAFNAGKKAFEDLNPDQAFRQFQKCIQLYEAGAAYVWDVELASRAWMYVGVSYLLSGKRQQAESAFLQALILYPESDIRKVSTEADKIKVFDEVKSQLGLAPLGVLEIRTTPSSTVYINGKVAGATPVRLRLRRGKHFVTVRREGYKHWGKSVTITGQTARYFMNMVPVQQRSSWLQSGKLALSGLGPQSEIPAGVAALGALTQARYLLVGKVKFTDEGKQISIEAAAYDMVNKKQLAYGGALAGWGTEPDVVRQLGRELLAGNGVKLGQWQPGGGPKQPPPPTTPKSGSRVGLAVGLTIGLLVLAGGGVVLALYLTGNLIPPQCPKGGSCVDIKLE